MRVIQLLAQWPARVSKRITHLGHYVQRQPAEHHLPICSLITSATILMPLRMASTSVLQ